MDYRYLITESLREKIAKAKLPPRLLRELRTIEDSQEKLNADLLHSTKIALERRKRPGGERIIWFEEKKQDGLCLYVLREIYLHDEYKKELKSKEGARIWQDNHQYDELEELEIQDAIDEYLAPKPGIESLPQEWYPYENVPRNFANDDIDDIEVYESKEWIDDFFEIKDKTVHSILLHDLRDLVSKQNMKNLNIWTKVKQVNDIDTNEFYRLEEGDLHVVFRLEVTNDMMKSVFLLSISRKPKYDDLKSKHYHSVDCELLKKRMKRCYPGFFLLDDGLSEKEIACIESKGRIVSEEEKLPLWLQVELDQDGQANLILSDEEIKLLRKAQYPFFINGLAGSGKSTLLYYLFAWIYIYQHKKYPEHSLLFLSYSDRLVAKARKFVTSILRLNKQFVDTQNVYISEDMEDFIKPFRTYLRTNFLTEEERNGLFANNKYIDYQEFKKRYKEECRLDEKKKITPDIVWSVIRVFIKGYKSKGYLRYQEYSAMFEKEGASKDLKTTTIDKDMFRLSEIIWDKWYRKEFEEKQTGWDDLDLVKFILNNERINKQYATVFCDEAQDFTKVETELIIKLSKHSLYDLSGIENNGEAPIAFAGDPNQTISPTGFRIGSIKKLFTDVFHELVGIDSYSFEEYPLEINYRSREGIVNFANTIQFIRHKLLDKSSSCNFQYAWDNEGTLKRDNKLDGFNYVAFYSLDKHPKLNDYMGKALSVLTSEDGEYYVTADNNASEEERNAAEETKKRLLEISVPLDKVNQNNVYTAITAKGLEFKSSIIYRFASIPNAADAVNAFHKGIVEGQVLTNKESFALAHFMTKLYVSVSRAKEVLFVLDTDLAYDKFWKYLAEPELWLKNIQRDYTITDDKFSLGLLLYNQDEELIAYSQMLDENFNAKQEAERLFIEAKQEKSAPNMKRARDYFSYDHNEDKMRLCDAYYSLFTGNGKDAGDMFLGMNETEEAIRAYWRSKCWKDLLLIPTIGGMQKLVSLYMSDSISIKQFMMDWPLYRDLIYQDINNSENIESEELWPNVINKIFADIKKLQTKEVTDTIIDSFDNFADIVAFNNEKYDILAELHYKRAQYLNEGRDFDSPHVDKPHYIRAIEAWDQAHNTEHKDYYESELMASKNISDRIKSMKRLLMNNEIISRYGSIDLADSLNDEAAGIVFNCLLSNDYSKAVAYPYPKDTKAKWQRLYSENRVRFLTDIVLEDFSSDKYYFLEDKILMEDRCLFEDKLPLGVFEMLFAIEGADEKGQPYWTYFVTLLKDEHGERVLFKGENRKPILEALSKQIDPNKEHNKVKASCFLEFLFGNDYNQKRAEYFNRTITMIFGHDVFFKEDFRRSTERNKYFTSYANLDNEAHDLIKNNIRKYVEFYIGTCKKVTSRTANDVKALFRAYEICVAYQGTTPDFLNICNMYRRCIKEEKLAEVKPWMEARLAFNQFMDDSNLMKASYSKLVKNLENKGLNIHILAEDFSKEDASMFVATVNSGEEEYSYDSIFVTSKLIYKHHLRRDNLKPYCRVNDLIAKLPDSIDVAIDEVLANKEHVDEYAIKILAYTWEALFDHTFIANHYNKLVDRKRLAKLRILTEYLKKRALLHYSYLKEKLFLEKQEEYDISMSKSYLPAAYPRIEERKGDKDFVEQTKSNIVAPTSPSLDAAKAAMLNAAKIMKDNGAPTTLIHQSLPILTIEEIEKL